MDLFTAIEARRSIRQFKPEPFPETHVVRALEAAILAPNSSNTQTWDFHWPKSAEVKRKIVEACLSQSAARTASHIMVVTADPSNWRRSQKPLVKWVTEVKAPKPVITYYEKLVPLMYRSGLLTTPLKRLGFFLTGLFRPIMRGPASRSDQEIVAMKSAALACENFVLAITAQGGATCMMEGFDETRIKRILGLRRSTRVVMCIGIGWAGERGTWGPRFRLPLQDVVHEY